MSITKLGIKGEQLAREFLQKHGVTIFQADWIGYKNRKYTLYEIKCKDRFTAPPFDGHGLDKKQVAQRLKFYRDTGIRCFLLIFEKHNIYGQWLDLLDKGQYHDTKKGIRIYPIDNFILLGEH